MGILSEAGAISRTFTDKMTLTRERVEQNRVVRETIYRDLPCAMSRSAHTASPSPAAMGLPMGESRYRMSLFMPSGTVTRLGDRVEIMRGRQVYRASASDSLDYGSHCVCVADIREVAEID